MPKTKEELNKMSWKNWSYWLNGGVVGFIVSFLIIYLDDFIRGTRFNLPVSFVVDWFGMYEMGEIMSVPYTIFGCIIIGVLIGFLYGKIKNRKQGAEK